MSIQIEVTDTFGGEANYSWVRRYKITDAAGLSDAQLVRRAKRAAGWTGTRCEKDDSGGMITLRPRNACQIMFINYCESEHLQGDEA
jgi:hypothetical protein